MSRSRARLRSRRLVAVVGVSTAAVAPILAYAATPSHAAPAPAGEGANTALAPAAIETITTTVAAETTTTTVEETTTTSTVAGTTLTTAPTTKTTTTSSSTPTPSYGFQKVRLGVQQADGSYVPPGTTTAGSVLTYTLTGGEVVAPTAKRGHFVEDGTYTCTTGTGTTGNAVAARLSGSSGTTSLCPFSDIGGDGTELDLVPGQSLTVKQVSAPAGLVKSTHTLSVGPCFAEPGDSEDTCDADDDTKVTDLVLSDKGLPPTTTPDTATVSENGSVDIDVLANDDSHGAPETITSVDKPKHGTAVISTPTVAAAALRAHAVVTQTIVYTPKAGFHGTDSFTYHLATGNGTATGHVTVTVTKVAVAPSSGATTPPTTTPPTVEPTGSTLPFTGTDAQDLLGFGAAALSIGSFLYEVGRRRRSS